MRSLSSLTALLFLLVAAPAQGAVSTTHSGWLWGNPEPQGNSLLALEFQGTTGYAGGDFGTLLRSNDGGTDWSAIRTGQTIDFRYVDMVDADSVVVASECAARRTDDGGATFRRLPFTSSERRCQRQLQAVSFPTEDVGYLLLRDGGVLRTSDGGRSFSPRTVVPAGPAGTPTALMFRNANEGLATTAAGEIFKTDDGGTTWSREFDGDAELHGVLFTDTRAVAVGFAGTFLSSPNDGESWTRPADDPGAPDPPAADFVDVQCVSATVCLMPTRAPGGGNVFRTADGGVSFTDTDISGTAVDFASATRAVAVDFGGHTELSDDAGANFATLGSRAGTGIELAKVRALSRSVAHAIGSAGTLVRTLDGGETWEDVGVATGEDVRDVWFVSEDLGYALDVAGGLFRTDNGGASWSILETDAPEAPNAVFAADGLNVFLIGPRGVLRSDDAGATFERHTHKVIRNRTLVDADRAGSSVVFYGPRVIAVSTNDGKTWRRISRPTSRNEVMDVDFVTSRLGYVLETDGRVWFTSNRGRTWAERVGSGHGDGSQLAFGDRRNGWLMLGRDVLRTTDGGRSWKPQVLGATPLSGLAADGSQTGYALIGSLGSPGILFTQGGGGAGTESTLRLSTRDRTVARRKKIKVTGRLTPAAGDEQVELRVRRLKGRRWRSIGMDVNRNGRFVFKQRIRRSTVFVAQWAGDADTDGDGSRPLIVKVG